MTVTSSDSHTCPRCGNTFGSVESRDLHLCTGQDHPLAYLIPELKPTDRCDRCGAQARMAALINPRDEHPLLFCGHHGAAHLPALQHAAVAIRDDRVLLEMAEAIDRH